MRDARPGVVGRRPVRRVSAYAERFEGNSGGVPPDQILARTINGSMNSGQTTALISKALNFTVYFVSRTMKDCSLDFQEELGR